MGAATPDALALDAPTGIASAFQGGHGRGTKRQAHDYYPTPADVTRAFLRVEGQHMRRIGGPVWEPCARGGAMLREIAAAGFNVIGTDIVADPDHGVTVLDARRAGLPPLAQIVVTNPPFAIAAEIIVQMLDRLDVAYLALLLKATFFHVDDRTLLYQRFRPAREWKLQWRADFLGGGAPVMDCTWWVWERPHIAGTVADVLPRHAESGQGSLL